MRLPDAERIRFLYRTDQGRADRATWIKGAAPLAALLLTFTAPWIALRPHIVHDLAKDPLFAPQIFAAYAYALFYAFALILIAVSYVNLSAKRFRDRGLRGPLGLASLVPLAALLAGAAHFAPILHPSVAGVFPPWCAYLFDAVLAATIGWTVRELGFKD